MKEIKSIVFKTGLRIFLILIFIQSCSPEEVTEQVVFENNFERNEGTRTNSINSANITFDRLEYEYFEYFGSRNLGRFGTGGLTLNLEGIEKHQHIRVEFDLFIHDKWEGNGERGNGEDVFILNVGPQTDHFSSIVNTKCMTRDCEARQSYPAIIGYGDNPENAGVTDPTLPGVCHYKDQAGGTKLIKINRVYPHTSERFTVNIAAGIKDAGSDLCLKSWSIDNLKISTLSLLER